MIMASNLKTKTWFNKANLRDLIAATGLVILLKLDSNRRVTVRKRLIWVKIDDFFSRMTLKFDIWPWKTIGHLFYTTSSFVHHFIAIGEFKLELQSGNAQPGSKSTIFFSRVTLKFDGWPWKNNRAPPLSIIKLYESFHHHKWIKTGVTVRKRLIRVKFDDF